MLLLRSWIWGIVELWIVDILGVLLCGSREKFTEKQAKIWWDENCGRIHMQYIWLRWPSILISTFHRHLNWLYFCPFIAALLQTKAWTLAWRQVELYPLDFIQGYHHCVCLHNIDMYLYESKRVLQNRGKLEKFCTKPWGLVSSVLLE